MPALLNAQSSRPYASTAFLTIASTSVDCETSVLTNMASPPAALISRTVSSPPSTTTSATTTLAPSRAKVRAVARPIPDPPPVTNAILPSTSPAIVSLLTRPAEALRKHPTGQLFQFGNHFMFSHALEPDRRVREPGFL